jgi:hypothetical protein
MTYTLFCQIPPICRKSQNAQTISILAFCAQNRLKPTQVRPKRCFASLQLRFAPQQKVLRKSPAPLRSAVKGASQVSSSASLRSKRCFASLQLRFAPQQKVLRKKSLVATRHLLTPVSSRCFAGKFVCGFEAFDLICRLTMHY